MKKIIFATGNQDKMREIREILADMDVEVVSMKEAGIHADIVENGSTFEENAVIKARTICEMTGEITLADDSGLEIDYLNKEPGIYSARYMGEDTSYHIKNSSLIERLNRETYCKVRMRCCSRFSGWKGKNSTWNHGRPDWLRREGRKWLWIRPDFLPSGIWMHFCRTFHGRKKQNQP